MSVINGSALIEMRAGRSIESAMRQQVAHGLSKSKNLFLTNNGRRINLTCRQVTSEMSPRLQSSDSIYCLCHYTLSESRHQSYICLCFNVSMSRLNERQDIDELF